MGFLLGSTYVLVHGSGGPWGCMIAMVKVCILIPSGPLHPVCELVEPPFANQGVRCRSY